MTLRENFLPVCFFFFFGTSNISFKRLVQLEMAQLGSVRVPYSWRRRVNAATSGAVFLPFHSDKSFSQLRLSTWFHPTVHPYVLLTPPRCSWCCRPCDTLPFRVKLVQRSSSADMAGVRLNETAGLPRSHRCMAAKLNHIGAYEEARVSCLFTSLSCKWPRSWLAAIFSFFFLQFFAAGSLR